MLEYGRREAGEMGGSRQDVLVPHGAEEARLRLLLVQTGTARHRVGVI